MIDIREIDKAQREGAPDNLYLRYKQNLRNRKMDDAALDQVLALYQEKKKLTLQFDEQRARQNKIGQVIAQKKRDKQDASTEMSEMQELAETIKRVKEQEAEAERKAEEAAAGLPNLCHTSVPVGKADTDNKIMRTVGETRALGFTAKDHEDIGKILGGIDSERAGKVTGARFTFLLGGVARLERALLNFMLDLQTKEHHYREMLPPYIVNSTSFYGTGQFPKFKDDVFHLTGTDYHLIPTAEVPVTNFFRSEILDEAELPKRYAAFSPCFRSEAGSYGRDTKGLIRQHQFHKVELMVFAHPDHSYEEHERLTGHAEEVLRRLELPYRVMCLCTGDIGFGAAKCYDLEVWLPSQKAYREISSCSNFEDFQARRADIRFRAPGGRPRFVHTINGSGLAVGRTLIAVLENYQQADGSVAIPKALQSYVDGQTLLKPGT